MEKPLIAPSLLSADFSCLGDGLRKIHDAGGDWVHLDIMDGSFVPNITFGPKMVEDLRRLSELPFDAHLMIVNPEKYVGHFARAGADYITFHLEASIHAHRLIEEIHALGKKAGISIVPSTPVQLLEGVLPFLDLILIMGVNPGFGGQSFIETSLGKITYLKERKAVNGFKYLISIDGGVNRTTAQSIRAAGAEIIISGSAFFSAQDPKEEVRFLREGG